MKTPLIVLAAAAAGLAACANTQTVSTADAHGVSAASNASGQCFRRSAIRNHTIGDDHTLYFDTGRTGVFRVTMSGACLAGAGMGDPLVMKSNGPSEQVCRPIDLDIRVSQSGFESACIVAAITPLTPAEVAALPPKHRP